MPKILGFSTRNGENPPILHTLNEALLDEKLQHKTNPKKFSLLFYAKGTPF